MLSSSAEGVHSFEQVLFDACALLRPPEKLTISQWADKYAVLSAEGSSRPGKWYTSNAEYQRFPMDLLSPGSPYETVVLMWASQVGKTQIGLHFVAYHMHHDPQPIIFIEPTEDLCKVIVRDRIEPMIRDTPVLTPLFGTRGGRNAGNDTMMKYYPGGSFAMGWANSPSQMASRARGIAVSDEEDRMEANKEGDPILQLRKRMATFKRRKHLRVSSPGLRRTSRIAKAHEQSDQFARLLPCPDCGHMQTLRFEQVKYIRASSEPGDYRLSDCWYECECCTHQIREADKFAMDRAGEWRLIQRGGDGKTAGLQLSSLYSTLGYTWAEIAMEYLQCEGNSEKLRVFANTVLALPWDEEAEGIELSEVAKHAEPYPAEAPMGVLLVTIGADVQKDRVEATRWGWGVRTSWVLEHRVFHGDPVQPDVWRDFDAWRRREVEHESGLTIPTAATFIDSGDGNRTQAVYEYTRKRVRERVFACKGSSQHGAPLVNRGSKVGRYKTWLFSVGTSTAKDTIYSRLGIADAERPGYIHFPDTLDSEYFAQLTAEKLVTHRTRGGEESRWEPQRKRNEALDCAVYNHAAREFLKADMPRLQQAMDARIARLSSSGILQQRLAARAATVAGTSPALQSRASSAASPSQPGNSTQNPHRIMSKKAKRVVKRPGFAWIHAAADTVLPLTPRRAIRAFLRHYMR